MCVMSKLLHDAPAERIIEDQRSALRVLFATFFFRAIPRMVSFTVKSKHDVYVDSPATMTSKVAKCFASGRPIPGHEGGCRNFDPDILWPFCGCS